MVIWNHGELPPEMGEKFEEECIEENLELKITIELEPSREPEQLVIERAPEYVPQDDYLQKELERQEQERLSKMLSEKIP